MAEATGSNFIYDIIDEDLKNQTFHRPIHTRFPPEPNGYMHIGHAKAICINFQAAKKYGGLCNLRFADTNPSREETEYVESIMEDIKWLGFDWESRVYYASNYFGKFYEYALQLIKSGDAFVCDLTAEEIREYRGTLTDPGIDSPCRNRSIEENLDLFVRMKNGEFPDGFRVLRAKIDMESPNLNMRDPVIYRIMRSNHHQTGDEWLIYPMYDFEQPLSDAIENITHSLCSLEFEDHRPLYDWVLKTLGFVEPPKQIEFARLNLAHAMLSKRKLISLVNDGAVKGWDDPRMPTISGFRRKGYTSASIRNFIEKAGVAKSNSLMDIALLEHCVREDLNINAPRAMAVLKPLKIVITNYFELQTEEFDIEINPEKPELGMRKTIFSKVLYIEEEDFSENPPKGYFRLTPGGEVRLKSAYIIKCEYAVRSPASGEITELRCTYDPLSKGGNAADGRKIKGTIHWVSADNSSIGEVRLYDNLFENPEPSPDDPINPKSLIVLEESRFEKFLAGAKPGDTYQFMRMGYFTADQDMPAKGIPVFNRTVTLKDTWAKMQKEKVD